MIEEGFTPAVDRRTVLKTGALAGAFAAFGGLTLAQDAAAQDGERSDLTFVVVSHGQASDPFWSVVQNGVAQAGTDMGVNVEYQAPGTFDMVAMSQLIDAAVATSPDGLVVSIPDADALSASITAAIEAGIPVISMNSGSDVAEELGILTHVGQTEYEAGLGRWSAHGRSWRHERNLRQSGSWQRGARSPLPGVHRWVG